MYMPNRIIGGGNMLTESGKKVIIIGLTAAIAYYIFGPVGLACVALVLLLKKSKDITPMNH